MITIAERLNLAYGRIENAVEKSQFSNQKTRLLAVSKTKSTTLILEAYQAGQRLFGESYVQESVEKISELKHLSDIEWHFIGPIQSNKSAQIASHFDWVQSVDRIKIARRLNDQRPKDMSPLNVLIQINIDNEQTKSGCTLAELDEIAAFIAHSEHLCLRGIMAIPKKAATNEQQAESFSTLKACYDALKTQYSTVDTLSVGMSNDAEAAIYHGSTMVRIGTDIFGPRT